MYKLRSAFALIIVLGVMLAPPLQLGRAASTSISDLQAKQKQLEDQAKAAELKATQQKTVAQRAADKIQEVHDEIGSLQNSIGTTDQSIQKTNQDIEVQNQEVAGLESNLRRLQDQQNAVVRQLYIARESTPDNLALFTDEPISQRETEQERFRSLEKAVADIYLKTQSAKKDVENYRAQLVAKNDQLQQLRTQQDLQQQGLQSVQLQQAQLKQNAETAVVQLEAQATADRQAAAKVEQQVSALVTALINASKRAGGSTTGVAVGETIHRGEVVGHVGLTGFTTGPHVHFEVRLNNTPVDPTPYIGSGLLAVPVDNYTVSQGFGYTSYARAGAYGGAIHTGIDFATQYGSPIYAACDGILITRQLVSGYGNMVLMQVAGHPDMYVLYGHMTGK